MKIACTSGGPLLCIGDLLQDLTKEQFLSPVDLPTSSSANIVTEIQEATLKNQSLSNIFETTSSQLNLALAAHTGQSWLGLTQKLYTTLAVTNKMLEFASLNLMSLLDEVKRLKRTLERGAHALLELENSMPTEF